MKGVNRLPVTASAKKRVRQTEKRRIRNRVYRSRARTLVKKTDRMISEGQWEEAAQAAGMALGALDKAAQKGVIHGKNAARRKSRLLRRLGQAKARSGE